MKDIYIVFSILLGILIFSNNTQAQVVDVCAGTDSVTLRAGNYHYGTVEWQYSYDNQDWFNIEGANDTIYKFLPEETRYYRCVAKFSECPPINSEVSLVQLNPQANAGADRVVPGDAVVMLANLNAGETGTWTSLDGGTFSDASDPYTEFSGNTDNTYQMVWTVTNACGTATDTINVEFRQNIYIDDIVVVDTTDNLLSDSAQMANGEYIIEFSDPVPTIDVGTILIGLAGDGFLQKVTAVTQNVSTFTMQTEQSTLEEITEYGAYDLAQVFTLDTLLSGAKSSHMQRLNHMPTRAELLNNPELSEGVHYYIVESEPAYYYQGVSLNASQTKAGGKLIDINFDETLISSGNIELNLNGHYSFTPNLRADLDHSGLHLHAFRFGMYNGVIDRGYEVALTASASANLLNHEFTLMSLNKDIIFVVAGVPIWVRTTLSLDGKLTANASAAMNVSHAYNKTSTYTSAIEYENGNWEYVYDEHDHVNVENDFNITGDLSQSFEIGPSINFKIFNIVGPYISAGITENLELCTYNDNWQANMNIGGQLTVGARAKIIGATLFDVSKTWPYGFYHLQLPNRLELVSGNNQNYTQGNELSQPIKLRVKSNKNFYAPYALVHFECQNGGSVSNNTVITDANGYAQTNWTPGGSSNSTLHAYILDCDGNHISNSPLIFNAYTGSADCGNSSLYVSITKNGNTIYPVAHMGNPPYEYSTDGDNYSSAVPNITTSEGNTYTFYVKDNNDCIAMATYTAPSDACQNTDLSLYLSVSDDNIEAYASGGTAPYEYAIDGGSFSSNNLFENVSSGSHSVNVKDANDCTTQRNIYVYSESSNNGDWPTDTQTAVVEVTNPTTGEIWMDRNLGASQVATSSTDAAAYGDLYQWGRAADGHQLRTSGTTSILATSDNPGHGDFITPGSSPYDWRSPQNDNLWQGVSGTNNPCPSGYRLPTEAEWEAERTSWSSNNAAGAFASPLKLPVAGRRSYSNGSLGSVGSFGYYWSSAVGGTYSRRLYFYGSDAGMGSDVRAVGYSVRCLKD
jgi:uncharacterized protein (TIGR02145 family)